MSKESDNIIKLLSLVVQAASVYVLYDTLQRTYIKRKKERLAKLKAKG